MLETRAERVELLKSGIDGKTIERLYIIYNGFKILNMSVLSNNIGQISKG